MTKTDPLFAACGLKPSGPSESVTYGVQVPDGKRPVVRVTDVAVGTDEVLVIFDVGITVAWPGGMPIPAVGDTFTISAPEFEFIAGERGRIMATLSLNKSKENP